MPSLRCRGDCVRNRPLVLTSMLSGLLTVTLFIYILLIPIIKGIPPNVGISPLLARTNVDFGRMCYICSIGPGVSQESYPQSYPCVSSIPSIPLP